MDRENYTHIYYLKCPHFTVGKVDQWGENGYLFYEGKIYDYHEDRKEQYGITNNPRTVEDFVAYANQNDITIPNSFLKAIGLL